MHVHTHTHLQHTHTHEHTHTCTHTHAHTHNTHVFTECPCHMRPHLLEVLLPVLGEDGGKGALLHERVGHVLRSEGFSLPMVNTIMVPRCVCVCVCVCVCYTCVCACVLHVCTSVCIGSQGNRRRANITLKRIGPDGPATTADYCVC